MRSASRTALAVLLSVSMLAGGPLMTTPAPATAAPDLSPTQDYWYSSGVKQSIWRAPNEVAVVFDEPSAKTAAQTRAAALVMGATPEVDAGAGLAILTDAHPRTLRGRLAMQSLSSVSNVKAQGAVYYSGPKSDSTRMICSGEVVLHATPGRAGDALVLAREMGLSLAQKLSWSLETYLLQCDDGDAALAAANQLQESGLATFAYPNWLGGVTEAAVPNDTHFADQWHLNNTGQGGGVAGNDIKVLGAWDSVRGTGKRIAVIDDSLQITHPDLSPNVATNGHWDYVDNDGDPSPNRSDDRHGTAVAGCAAGRGFNGIGVSGSAPSATLLGRRIQLGSGYDDVETADALALAAPSVDVVNCSFAVSSPELAPNSPVVDNALAYGTSSGRGGKGTIYVVASGNGGKDYDNANYSGLSNSRRVVTVAASDANGNELDYSEGGACVLVNAPSGPPGKDSNGDPCVAQATAASQPSGQHMLRTLYGFRDTFLAQSDAGRALAAEYYTFSGTVVKAAVLDGGVRSAIGAAVPLWLPLIESLGSDGRRIITANDVDAFYRVIAEFKGIGNDDLTEGLSAELECARPEQFIGKTIGELWAAFESAKSGASSAQVTPAATAQANLPLIPTTDRTGSDGYNPETTDNDYPDYENQDYTKYFNGTSAATPIVSGVVALMLEANPGLTWRDVTKILAVTATKNDASDEDWAVNAAGYHVNHKYGFGRVNASEAVAKARSWTNLGPETTYEQTAWANIPINEYNPFGVTSSITVPGSVNVERVEVVLSAPDHRSYGDLSVQLISPSGTVSNLAYPHKAKDSARYDNWRFSSVRLMGEDARGTWKLKVTDKTWGNSGTLKSWTLKVYGTSADGDAPIGVGEHISALVEDGHGHALQDMRVTLRSNAGAALETAYTNDNGVVVFSREALQGQLYRFDMNLQSKPESGKPKITMRYGPATDHSSWGREISFNRDFTYSKTWTRFPVKVRLTNKGEIHDASIPEDDLDNSGAVWHWLQLNRKTARAAGFDLARDLDVAVFATGEDEHAAWFDSDPHAILFGSAHVDDDTGGLFKDTEDTFPAPWNFKKNRESHEFGHALMFSILRQTHSAARSVGNHAGYMNDNTGDSLSEGWATFWAMYLDSKLGIEGAPHVYDGFGELAGADLKQAWYPIDPAKPMSTKKDLRARGYGGGRSLVRAMEHEARRESGGFAEDRLGSGGQRNDDQRVPQAVGRFFDTGP